LLVTRIESGGVVERTDGAGVDLDGGVEVGEEANCICALRKHGAGNGEAAEGEDGEVGETHVGLVEEFYLVDLEMIVVVGVGERVK
jgi:hypothetical protein